MSFNESVPIVIRWILAALIVPATLWLIHRQFLVPIIANQPLHGFLLYAVNVVSISFILGMISFPITIVFLGLTYNDWKNKEAERKIPLPVIVLLCTLLVNFAIAALIVLMP